MQGFGDPSHRFITPTCSRPPETLYRTVFLFSNSSRPRLACYCPTAASRSPIVCCSLRSCSVLAADLQLQPPPWVGPRRDNEGTTMLVQQTVQRHPPPLSRPCRSSSLPRSYSTRPLPPTSSPSHGPANISVRPWSRILLQRLYGSASGARRHHQFPVQPRLASPSHSWPISSMVGENARYVLPCAFVLFIFTLRFRCAIGTRRTCILRSPPGSVFAETPSVVRNSCRSGQLISGSFWLTVPQGRSSLLQSQHSPTCDGVALDRVGAHQPE